MAVLSEDRRGGGDLGMEPDDEKLHILFKRVRFLNFR